MQFKEDFLLKSSPSGEVKFYYLKRGKSGDFKLADVIESISENSVSLSVTDEKQSAEALITISRESCSDGMSETHYPYSISFVWGDGGGWSGCGRDPK